LLKIRDAVGSFLGKLSYASMVIVFFLVCMTTVDVIIRKLTPLNIMGSYELTEMGMVIILWIAIAYYQVFKGHIRVTMLVEKFPEKVRLFLEILVHLFGAVIMAFCFYAGVLRVQADLAKQLSTAVLHIPQFPFSIVMVIGEALFCLMLLIDAIIAAQVFAKSFKKSESVSES